MDEAAVRNDAETHARATVEGNFKIAGSFLAPQAMAQAGDVMKAMPGTLTGSEITSVETDGDECVVQIRYVGEDGETTVESRWADHDGATKITSLEVL